MALKKQCGCATPAACAHRWFYMFRVHRLRYRATTGTANEQEAKRVEAAERARILARHSAQRTGAHA
jgi:hypothetical protein